MLFMFYTTRNRVRVMYRINSLDKRSRNSKKGFIFSDLGRRKYHMDTCSDFAND